MRMFISMYSYISICIYRYVSCKVLCESVHVYENVCTRKDMCINISISIHVCVDVFMHR